MTPSPAPIYVLGDANVDVLMPIDEYPAPGEDKRSERTVIESGGSAANTASALAKFGLPTILLAAVGRDVLADLALAGLESAGVNLEHIQTNDEATGVMFVPVTPDGQRTLFGRRGANRLLEPEELPLAGLERGRALHLSGYALLEDPQAAAARQALDRASLGEGLVSLDTAYEPPFAATSAFRQVLPELDLLILGEPQIEVLTGNAKLERSLGQLLDQGLAVIAVKRGRQGSLLVTETEEHQVPAFAVETIDTTGAGDCYAAGLLYGLLKGLPLPATGLLASAAGALATTRWGAGSNVPGLADALNLIRERASTLAGDLQAPCDHLLERLGG